MNARETYRDVPMNGRNYRLQKMDPRMACFIFTTLGAKAETNILDALGHCTRAEFDELQGFALKFISKLDERDGLIVPIPIMGGNGLWGDKDLEGEPNSVLNLTMLSLAFNMEPFLVGNGSTSLPSNP